MYEIEHSFIDFKFLTIGEKIRHASEPEKLAKLKYDHEYFANLIIEQEENSEFFMQSSINKLIDFQFETKTKRFM